MDENSELEEGEAFYHQDDDGNINPDIAFSYFDEKIKNVLGHFQKDFEGGVSAENLGAKFGGYGSFLPTYERSPPRLSHPKTPQRNSSTQRSPNNLSMEGVSQNLKAPPNAPPTGRPVNASCLTEKRDSHLSSTQVADKSALKDESFNRAGIPSDQKTLKVRIKMGSDNKAKKNAAIYSGLGLDYSPSLSLGNSLEESGGTVMISQETTGESPTRILQVMTSYHVPGGVLISPLHDSLLCLLRKEKERPSRDSKSILSLKSCQEHSPGLMNESSLGNGKQLHEKKTKFLMGKSEKLVESKHENCMNVENDKTLLIKRKSENEIAGGKELLPNDLKRAALSNSVKVADSMEATARAFDASAEDNQDAPRGRLFSSDLAKEDSLESMSGRSRTNGKKKKWDTPNSSVEKAWEKSVVNSNKNGSLDPGDNVGSKCYQNPAPLKCKEDSKMKFGQKATFHVKNKINIPSKKEKTLFEGKKSKGSKNTGHTADLIKESLRLDVGETPKDTTGSSQGFYTGKNKIHKLKLQKDIFTVRDNHRDAFDTNFEQKSEQMNPSMGPSQNRRKDSGPMDFETELIGYLDRSKEIFSGRTVDNQLSRVDSPGVDPHLTDKTLASQTATAAAAATASVVIQENWVQCDRCHKWRLLPFDTKPEQLPEKWLCSMLNWLPGMNRCDISEEETTKALNALYQVPVAEIQNNPQNHANGSAPLVTSANLQHLDQNNSSVYSRMSSIRGKKKHGLKEVCNAGSSGRSQMSNSKNNQQQESFRSRSLNDTTQVPVESNLTKKSSFEQKEKHPVGGETKQAKMKNKRDSGLYAYEGSKKTKTEVKYTSDNHKSSNLDPRRMGLNSSAGLPTQANGRSLQNYNECVNSGDVKHDLKERSVVSVKRLVDKTQVSADGGSLDMRICDKRASVKKRKLEDWQGSQNRHESYVKEESSESGFRNEKKLRVSKIEGRQSHRNDADGTSNRKTMIGGIEEVRSIDRNQPLSKHKKKCSSQRTLESLDPSRRVSGTGQISMAATSSSSKVSGSCKTRANFEEGRGSPVESVSSSPMRTSYPVRFVSIVGDGSGKDAATNSGIHLSGSFRISWDGEGTVEAAQSGTEIKENVSGDFNPRSHKSSALNYQDRDSVCKISIKTKPSSRLGNSHLPNGDSHFTENGQHAIECSHGEDRVNKDCQGNALFSQESDKGSSSQAKDSKRSFTADKTKVYDPMDEQDDLFSRKSTRYQSNVDPKGLACYQETIPDCKGDLPKFSKDEKNCVGMRDPSGQWSSDSRIEAKSNIKHDGFDVKSAASCSTKRNTAPEKNPQDFSGQTEVMQVEIRSGMSKSSLHCEVESQQETKGHHTVPEAQQGVFSDGCPINGSGNVDASKTLKQLGKVGSEDRSAHSLGQHMPDLCVVRDFNSRSPVNSSSQPATNALNDAKKLRNYAERLKSSGFVFESNEIYFQAALKFLGIAAFLETSNSESSRHGDMNQMQVYSTATKLFEMCAQEYGRRREMAAAALAYKCMEVAYMRVVYCKHSTSSRDRNELQATLHMVPQGESPSSSASDVDNNLNNQPTVDKAPLTKGNVSLVAGTHVIVARNRPSFVRLLDYTQDISFAMEASQESQNAFAAASSLEEAQNAECITSVKKVVDFSFQDVDGLICLVQHAMEAISCSGLGGARD